MCKVQKVISGLHGASLNIMSAPHFRLCSPCAEWHTEPLEDAGTQLLRFSACGGIER